MKICILTFEFNYNYGAVLQAFALSKSLEKMGHQVFIMNRGWQNFSGCTSTKLSLKKIPGHLMGKYITLKPFLDFKKEYLSLTRPIKDAQDLKSISEQFDAVVVGSDQIWNDEIFSYMDCYYFAESFSPSQLKIAYAVSMGKDSFTVPTHIRVKLQGLLNQFKAISVRENSGIKLMEQFGIKAKWVLDPTLLLDKSEYPQNTKINHSKYLCKFFLDENVSKNTIAQYIAQSHNIGIKNNYLNKNFNIPIIRKIINNKYLSIHQWISNIRDAQFVITDSFHGMVFSIIFNKQFYVIKNAKRGNTRFESLLDLLNLTDRLIDENTPIDSLNFKDKIDYIPINKQLSNLKETSINFLKQNINQ
ncbi:polysaccharide pyruvyl transferase family protein [Bacteroides stercoris]|uniref:polysaccharide pyruvyl transferase family protein n=1 Tax=Bacteroides stercoris TaxID=46506 RepID=UPI00234D2785|nr:polysaccharide pyruvyl transferase family protein [Bacteroides stercoris]MDC7168583.1 polysaccharide pyruvyl transferase family protein [Bacteroides stercoris]